MVNRSISIDKRFFETLTPLQRQAARKLMAGADVNALNHNGNTALHAAVCSGNIDLLFMLLHQGAKLNGANGSTHTPLHLALIAGNTAAFLLLTPCPVAFHTPTPPPRNHQPQAVVITTNVLQI